MTTKRNSRRLRVCSIGRKGIATDSQIKGFCFIRRKGIATDLQIKGFVLLEEKE